jgi:hypothetical protein
LLEYHTSARFAWIQKNTAEAASKPRLTGSALILHVVHNLLFWFFFVPFVTPMSYRTGFAVYSAILLVRLIANTYINLRDMSPAQYHAYPLRIP